MPPLCPASEEPYADHSVVTAMTSDQYKQGAQTAKPCYRMEFNPDPELIMLSQVSIHLCKKRVNGMDHRCFHFSSNYHRNPTTLFLPVSIIGRERPGCSSFNDGRWMLAKFMCCALFCWEFLIFCVSEIP